jgi:lipopolysaccharide transport system ATP-binding protein
MKPIIKAENISKQYRIGSHQPGYSTLRESIMQWFTTRRSASTEYFWALRDLSFQADPGEVIGVIGRNGAGKSTLLKIFSRITEPTTGRVELYGRVGSLLEVGTGFHPELTGRENVLMNGAILGMRRAEILRKFDDIVGFAEVEKFIDTPVKRYSSGMYLRLAFAVAAFLESEILLVDEVLAVGDAAFQKKCLGKMQEVSSSGRTILFVSHNMAAVEGLCNRCLFISEGKLVADGKPHAVISGYFAGQNGAADSQRDLTQHPGRRGGLTPVIRSVALETAACAPAASIRMGQGLTVKVGFDAGEKRIRPRIAISIKNNYGVPVLTASTRIQNQYEFADSVGAGSIACHLADLPLLQGTYSIDLFLSEEYQNLDVIYDAISFDVVESDVFGTGQVPTAHDGTIFWPATFDLSTLDRVPAMAATAARTD